MKKLVEYVFKVKWTVELPAGADTDAIHDEVICAAVEVIEDNGGLVTPGLSRLKKKGADDG